MIRIIIVALVLVMSLPSLWASERGVDDPLVLNGQKLSLEDVVAVARHHQKIKIPPETMQRVERSHRLLLLGAKQDMPIYGLNRGVGLNKDRSVFKGDTMDPEVKTISENFNRAVIHSHSVAIPEELTEEEVRAVMLVRLNTLLRGVAGIQPEAVELLANFLNRGIHPVLPAHGSVGEADITILAHLGLAMMGEGEVSLAQQKLPAWEVFELAGLEPLQPFAKDALSIISSNAYSVGLAALVLYDLEGLLTEMNKIFAMSLEAMNGNVAPFLVEVQRMRPFCGQWLVAEEVRDILQGSSLFQKDSQRALQDPLSFRIATQVHGALLDVIRAIKPQIEISLNSSDDNPAVVLDATPSATISEAQRQYYVEGEEIEGAIFPTGNFEPLTWVIKFESLGVALAHVAHNSSQRMIHLAASEETGLARFLAPDQKTLAFATIQKTFSSLYSEIRSLANPVSMDFIPLAGGIEDHATNAPAVVQRVVQIVDRLLYIFAIEKIHAAQGLDLRMRDNPEFHLSAVTQGELVAFREAVPFLDKDRILSADIEAAAVQIKEQTGYVPCSIGIVQIDQKDVPRAFSGLHTPSLANRKLSPSA